LRRTEIVVLTWCAQSLCGSNLVGYSTVFYISAGLAQAASFDMTMIQYAVGAIGTVFSWVLMSRAGRRTLYVYGLLCLFCLLLVVGFTSLAPNNSSRDWAIGSMLLVITFVYDSTVGPVCYSLVAEMPSGRLRAKSIVIARNIYNVVGIVTGILTNYQLTTTAWNWGAKSAFFWAGSCFCLFAWTFFRLPEPKGRTYAELDVLFEQRVPARKFKTTTVDLFLHASPVAAESNSSGELNKEVGA
jgi:SP family general alpha glucoside:H+ symporter-like MFS transporter